MPISKIKTQAIEDSAVTSAKIGVDVIVAEDIANNAVTVAELADNAVTNAKLADNAVDTTEIVDNAVTTNKIADGQVTSAKLDTNIDIAGTLDVTGVATFDSDVSIEDSDLHVDGNISFGSNSSDSTTNGRILTNIGSGTLFGQSSIAHPIVITNDQGTDNEAIILNDAANTSSAYVFSVAHLNGAGYTDVATQLDGTEAWVNFGGVTGLGFWKFPKQPCFTAYVNNDNVGETYNITSNEGTLIANTEEIDVGGVYNTSNGRFTAPIDGVYQLSFHLSLYANSSTQSDNTTGWGFYKNGSRYNWRDYDSALSIAQSTPWIVYGGTAGEHEVGAPHLMAHISLSAGDYIQVGWKNLSITLGIRSFVFTGRLVQ